MDTTNTTTSTTQTITIRALFSNQDLPASDLRWLGREPKPEQKARGALRRDYELDLPLPRITGEQLAELPAPVLSAAAGIISDAFQQYLRESYCSRLDPAKGSSYSISLPTASDEVAIAIIKRLAEGQRQKKLLTASAIREFWRESIPAINSYIQSNKLDERKFRDIVRDEFATRCMEEGFQIASSRSKIAGKAIIHLLALAELAPRYAPLLVAAAEAITNAPIVDDALLDSGI